LRKFKTTLQPRQPLSISNSEIFQKGDFCERWISEIWSRSYPLFQIGEPWADD